MDRKRYLVFCLNVQSGLFLIIILIQLRNWVFTFSKEVYQTQEWHIKAKKLFNHFKINDEFFCSMLSIILPLKNLNDKCAHYKKNTKQTTCLLSFKMIFFSSKIWVLQCLRLVISFCLFQFQSKNHKSVKTTKVRPFNFFSFSLFFAIQKTEYEIINIVNQFGSECDKRCVYFCMLTNCEKRGKRSMKHDMTKVHLFNKK